MKVVYSTRKISDLATQPTIFELKPLEPKKDFLIFEIRMNNTCTCNYKENYLQHKQNPLWQFSRQNLSEQ